MTLLFNGEVIPPGTTRTEELVYADGLLKMVIDFVSRKEGEGGRRETVTYSKADPKKHLLGKDWEVQIPKWHEDLPPGGGKLVLDGTRRMEIESR